MAHFVTGLIARRTALRVFANRYGLPAPVVLNEVLALLPLDEDMLDALLPEPAQDFVAGFNMLSPGLMQVLQAGSEHSTLLYFETEYFGGMGTQGAAVFRDCELVFGPQSAELGAINNALVLLGVRTFPPAVDEFETVGLHLHRSTDEWLASATDD